MNTLVRILTDDDGNDVEQLVWHLSDPCAKGVWGAVFCTGEVYGVGESNVIYEVKHVGRGVGCEKCVEKLKAYKAVKL